MNASIFATMDGYQVDGSSPDGELKLDLRRINFKICCQANMGLLVSIGGMISILFLHNFPIQTWMFDQQKVGWSSFEPTLFRI